ncbi:MAG TPA: class II aldolase/adducin family protein [Candidatus Tumulicola sp.]|nr:class II aldolase/adducin family protein [Candidatus Tumulicola sp.]
MPARTGRRRQSAGLLRSDQPTQPRLRAAIVATARKMNALGINRGTAGNVSVRSKDGFLITPSAMAYDAMKPADVVAVDANARARGLREPSTEWRFHHAIYVARPEVGAIVHTHSVFATALACLDRSIPAFHYMVAKAGGNDIRCAPYATFGTQELADEAVRALDGRQACLLSHHGMIAVGADLDAALAMAVEVEWLAETYCRVLQIGNSSILDADEIARNRMQFLDYGTQRRSR